jgi:hypothetical protein
MKALHDFNEVGGCRTHDLLTGNEVELIESTYHSADRVEDMRFLLPM